MAKEKRYRTLSTVLLAMGGVAVVTCLVWMGLRYPWQTLFGGETPPPDSLPDPAPLPTVEAEDLSSSPEQPVPPTEPDPAFVGAEVNLTSLGILKIPKIQISQHIVEGSDYQLLYGVGHVAGTAMPGEAGNCVLAGHRNAASMHPFRYLDKLELGDLLSIKDGEQVYTYKVFEIFEVPPEEVWVMESQAEERHLLTLITCTPVLTMEQRLIVWCRLTDTQPL